MPFRSPINTSPVKGGNILSETPPFSLASALHEWYRPNATDVGTTVTAVDTGSIGGLDMVNPTAAAEPDFNSNTFGFDGVQQELYNGVSNFRSGDNSGVIHIKFKATDNTGSKNNHLFSISNTSAADFLEVRYKDLKLELVWGDGGIFHGIRQDVVLTLNDINTATFISTGSVWVIGVNGVAVATTPFAGSNNGNWLADITASTENIVMGARETTINSFGKSDIYGVWYEPYTTQAAALANGLDIQNNAV